MGVRWWCLSLLKLHSDLFQWWTPTFNRWRRFIYKIIRPQIATAPAARKNRPPALTNSLINKSNSSSSSLRHGCLSKISCSTDSWPPLTTMLAKILPPRDPRAQIPYWIVGSCLNNKIKQRSPLVLSRRLLAQMWEWAAEQATLKCSRRPRTSQIILARWIPRILIIRAQPSAWWVLGPTDLCLCKNPTSSEKEHENLIKGDT